MPETCVRRPLRLSHVLPKLTAGTWRRRTRWRLQTRKFFEERFQGRLAANADGLASKAAAEDLAIFATLRLSHSVVDELRTPAAGPETGSRRIARACARVRTGNACRGDGGSGR